jgi:hypothetical protein
MQETNLSEQDEARSLHAMQAWINIYADVDSVFSDAANNAKESETLHPSHVVMSLALELIHRAKERQLSLGEDSPFNQEQAFSIYSSAIMAAAINNTALPLSQANSLCEIITNAKKKACEKTGNPNEQVRFLVSLGENPDSLKISVVRKEDYTTN